MALAQKRWEMRTAGYVPGEQQTVCEEKAKESRLMNSTRNFQLNLVGARLRVVCEAVIPMSDPRFSFSYVVDIGLTFKCNSPHLNCFALFVNVVFQHLYKVSLEQDYRTLSNFPLQGLSY